MTPRSYAPEHGPGGAPRRPTVRVSRVGREAQGLEGRGVAATHARRFHVSRRFTRRALSGLNRSYEGCNLVRPPGQGLT